VPTADRVGIQGCFVRGFNLGLQTGTDCTRLRLSRSTLLQNWIGIVLGCSESSISGNVVSLNDDGLGNGRGIELGIGSNGTSLKGNDVLQNGSHGIAISQTEDVALSGNTSVGNGDDGIFLSSNTQGISVRKNVMGNNGLFDIQDTAPAGANRFKGNICESSQGAGVDCP
jgi:parallel beta-helix repeat protein